MLTATCTSETDYPVISPKMEALYLLLTNRCNLVCKHCCVWSGPNEAPGLGVDEALGVVEQASKLFGPIRFILGGGEPLMRHQAAISLLERSTTLGMNSLLLTNGMFFSPTISAELARIPELRIRVSFDGTTPEAHDDIRGKGAFGRTMRGIEALRTAGYEIGRLEIAVTIYPGREAEMDNILDFADMLGVRKVKMKALSKLGRALEFWPNRPVSSPDADTDQYRRRLDGGYSASHQDWEITVNNDKSFGEINAYYDGSIYAYSFMGEQDQANAYLGNVRHQSLAEIFEPVAHSKSIVAKFLRHATGPSRSLRCLNMTKR